ncbi:WG repeat-containing protein [Spirochaeta dissipatitropha]
MKKFCIGALLLLILACNLSAQDEAYPFLHEGLWGVIDSNLNLIRLPEYHRMFSFSSCGHTVALKRNTHSYWDVLDSKGSILYQIEDYYPDHVSEHHIKLTSLESGANKLISVNGDLIPNTDNFNIRSSGLFDGYIAVIDESLPREKSSFFLDSEGNDAFPDARFSGAGGFSDGLAIVRNIQHDYGFINTQGELAIPKKFWEVGIFSEGLAFARIEDTIGYINKSGEFVFTEHIEFHTPFSDGVAMVMTDRDKHDWRIIDKNGNWVTDDLNIATAQGFNEGLASFGILEQGSVKYGFMDTRGNIVIEPQFDKVGLFFSGRFNWFQIGDRSGIIDREGNIYWSEDILAQN